MATTGHPEAKRNYTPPKVIREKSGRVRFVYKLWNLDTRELVEKKRDFGVNQLEGAEKEREIEVTLQWLDRQLRAGAAWSPKALAAKERQAKEAHRAADFADVVAALSYALKLKVANMSHRGTLTYTNHLKQFRQWLELTERAGYPADGLSPQIMLEYQDYLTLEGKAARTVNNYVATVGTLFNALQARGVVDENPAKGLEVLRVKTKMHRVFSDEERAKCEAYMLAESPELYAVTRLVYYCFIRRAELARLKVANVRLTDRALVMHPDQTKSGKGQTVAFPAPVFDILNGWNLERYPADYALLSTDFRPGRKHLHPNTFTRRHTDMLKAVGVYDGRLTLYGWKHTGAVNYFRRYQDIFELSKQMRHASLADTEVYLRDLGVLLRSDIGDKTW